MGNNFLFLPSDETDYFTGYNLLNNSRKYDKRSDQKLKKI